MFLVRTVDVKTPREPNVAACLAAEVACSGAIDGPSAVMPTLVAVIVKVVGDPVEASVAVTVLTPGVELSVIMVLDTQSSTSLDCGANVSPGTLLSHLTGPRAPQLPSISPVTCTTRALGTVVLIG